MPHIVFCFLSSGSDTVIAAILLGKFGGASGNESLMKESTGNESSPRGPFTTIWLDARGNCRVGVYGAVVIDTSLLYRIGRFPTYDNLGRVGFIEKKIRVADWLVCLESSEMPLSPLATTPKVSREP